MKNFSNWLIEPLMTVRSVVVSILWISVAISLFAWGKITLQIGKFPLPSDPDKIKIGWSNLTLGLIENSLIIGFFCCILIFTISLASIFIPKLKVSIKRITFEVTGIALFILIFFGNFGNWWSD